MISYSSPGQAPRNQNVIFTYVEASFWRKNCVLITWYVSREEPTPGDKYKRNATWLYYTIIRQAISSRLKYKYPYFAQYFSHQGHHDQQATGC